MHRVISQNGNRVLFERGRNPKASSHGYAQKQLACAAAAAHSQGRRRKQLERDCDLGKESRNARSNERRHRSGKGLWKQLAKRFKSGRWY